MSTAGTPSKRGAPVRDDPSAATVSALALVRLGHGLPLWLSLLLPAALGALFAATVLMEPAGTRDFVYGHWFGLTVFLWSLLVPMCGALYAGSAGQIDEDARRVLYGYAFPRRRLLFGTFTAIILIWAASALILGSLVSVTSLAMNAPADVPAAFGGALIPVLAAFPTLVLCLLASEAWGVAGAACTGVAGTLFGALLGDKPVWWFFPPSWPTRSALPLGETPLLGGALPDGHPLLDTSVLPVIALMSLALTALLLLFGSFYIDRREL
ncbi:hypothetical protein J0910_11865 [Nocardiopsis sp. CNT-189]|uniref:hypothetical protein n=1 Tax=Nocardiopsis oceanisediminis TaxID=2816862 RepID=UPI003B32A4E8